PSFRSYPALPSPPRSIHFAPGYNVTTHIIPASHPRQSFLEPRRHSQLEPKRERQAWAIDTASKLRGKRAALRKLCAKNHDSGVLKDPQQELPVPVLWNVVNRYARVGAPKEKKDIGIIVVVAHSNGFHKEVWESTIKHLISFVARPSTGIHIDEIWSIDAVNSGDSALLNEKYLGDVFDWIDHARDVLNLVEDFIPEGPFVASTQPLPVHLDRVSSECSHGAGSLASVACANPNIFHSITLVEPIIFPEPNSRADSFVMGSLLRRPSWSSRKEAKAHFLRNPTFNVWAPEILDLYIQYGLVDIPPSDGAALSCVFFFFPQEAVCFADDFFEKETYEMLEELDEKVKIKWIMARGPLEGRTADLTQATVWRRPVNSTNVKINSSHLVCPANLFVMCNPLPTLDHVDCPGGASGSW
ncbi:hypothetical protein BS47DRAFT_1309373, partial [Hydnum rufescens UP504]